jgi:ribonuclease G
MTDRQLIINANSSETRIALLEKDRIAEIFIERKRERGIVGNIYLGTVMRVLPGMQAAFVDIGTERTAFLYGGDVLDPDMLTEQRLEGVPQGLEDLNPDELRERTNRQRKPIEKLLREGQQVLVQVAKEPLGSKGARVTMFLSLPGRFLVIMPDFTHIGISRRIEDLELRQRLTDLVKAFKPDDIGVIVRTAAANIDTSHLEKDLKFLLKTWRQVDSKKRRQEAPALLYQDLDIALKTTRDLYADDIERIVVDDVTTHEELKKFLAATIPGAAKRLELYSDEKPIFDVYGIELDISRALSSKIDLPSGGYLVIDQTEALTAFDINTGKYVGKGNAHETILKTNLEAVKKIVAQLRIRNIGGIIVIDFIDMERPEDRETVYNALQEELKHDKARTNVLRISELGLVQMTRKRTAESLERRLMTPCGHCQGRGRIRSVATEAFDLIREIRRCAVMTGQKSLTVKLRDDLLEYLHSEEAELLHNVTAQLNLKIEFKPTSLKTEMLHEAAFEVILN